MNRQGNYPTDEGGPGYGLDDAELLATNTENDLALPTLQVAPLRWIRVLSRGSGVVAILMLTAATLLIVADMISRNIAGRSISGTTEISSWFMACIGWLSLSYTLRADGHIQVTFGFSRLSRQLQRLCAPLLSGGAVIFLSFTTAAMTDRLRYFFMTNASGVETGYPIWWLYSIVLLGAILFTLQFLALFIDDCYRLKRGQ